jgi:pyridoxine kinase
MPRVLILSSFVAASRVGGSAQALALARLGIEPVLAPTVTFGRHPGYGPPGGAAVAAETFEGLLTGIAAQSLAFDAVIAGYFATPEQVAAAAETVRTLKAASTRIIVDPIMGDADKGLYVKDAVATAIADLLVPLADVVTPNAWELTRLTGAEVTDATSAVAAARRLGRPALVSSVAAGERIGVVYADAGAAWLASHDRAAMAPKGTGDLLAAFFAAALVRDAGPADALAVAVGALAEIVAASGAGDPPVAALPTTLTASRRVRVEALGG